MTLSYSKTIIMGNIGKPPKTGVTRNGKKYASFSVATARSYSGENREAKEAVTWHSVTAWGSQAEYVEKYLEKGSLVLVEGEYLCEVYTDKQGNKVNTFKLNASNVRGLGSKTKKDTSTEPKNLKKLQSYPSPKSSNNAGPGQEPYVEDDWTEDGVPW